MMVSDILVQGTGPVGQHACRLQRERGENMSQHDEMAPPDDVPLNLNPLVSAETFSDDFSKKGRVHIADILTDAAAQRLLRALQQETP
jgi:hypothetical protein